MVEELEWRFIGCPYLYIVHFSIRAANMLGGLQSATIMSQDCSGLRQVHHVVAGQQQRYLKVINFPLEFCMRTNVTL